MLAMINRMVHETSRATNLLDALNLIVTHIQETLSSDATSIFLCDDDTGEYVLLATEGLDSAAVGKVRLNFAEGLIGLVGEREEPITVQDTESPSFLDFTKLNQAKYLSFLVLPIIHRSAFTRRVSDSATS